MTLFAAPLPPPRSFVVPDDAREMARRRPEPGVIRDTFVPQLDARLLDVYARANNVEDPFELRDLWLGRVEAELGDRRHRPWLAARWRSSRPHRRVSEADVLNSRTTVRFVKELFNWFFREDLYGDFRRADHVILSSGAVDEVRWGLPEALKECLRYALARDWYGYSDSRGRMSTREAVAAYENARMPGASYTADNVAVTLGATFAVSSLADFILRESSAGGAPALCGIPNYPPLVESVARRRSIQLVPLPVDDGHVSYEPLIAALTPGTPLVLVQTAANPTGAAPSEHELSRLIATAPRSAMIVLDESHEWLGPAEPLSLTRAAPNVIRVSSISKSWAAPGLKIGWIMADRGFVADYYEYASTTFGGPPSFFYTMIEMLARMERWLICGVEPSVSEVKEFEPSYGLTVDSLAVAFDGYRRERLARARSLCVFRDAAVAGLADAADWIIRPRYSVNVTARLPGWNDSYLCFRDLLCGAGISVFPGILAFYFADSIVRITTARPWHDLSPALARLQRRTRAAAFE